MLGSVVVPIVVNADFRLRKNLIKDICRVNQNQKGFVNAAMAKQVLSERDDNWDKNNILRYLYGCMRCVYNMQQHN